MGIGCHGAQQSSKREIGGSRGFTGGRYRMGCGGCSGVGTALRCVRPRRHRGWRTCILTSITVGAVGAVGLMTSISAMKINHARSPAQTTAQTTAHTNLVSASSCGCDRRGGRETGAADSLEDIPVRRGKAVGTLDGDSAPESELDESCWTCRELWERPRTRRCSARL